MVCLASLILWKTSFLKQVKINPGKKQLLLFHLQWRSAPPRSSADTSSPVAALTYGKEKSQWSVSPSEIHKCFPNTYLPTCLYLQLSFTELKNILFSNSTHLANLDHIFSCLQMKNLNPESLWNLPTDPEHVMDLDLNPGTSGRKACPLPHVR